MYDMVSFFISTENFCHVTDKKMRADLGCGPGLWKSLPGQWLVTVGVSHQQLWGSRALCRWRSPAEALCPWCREGCCASSEGPAVTSHPKEGRQILTMLSSNYVVNIYFTHFMMRYEKKKDWLRASQNSPLSLSWSYSATDCKWSQPNQTFKQYVNGMKASGRCGRLIPTCSLQDCH